jgi:CMP-N-acetylneuraminic acid synthetase
MRTVAIVPARGGSKGIVRKNLRLVAGKPLIYWSIQCARDAGLEVFVSTEDEEIRGVASSLGALPIVRPMNLASDSATGLDVVLHAVGLCHEEFDNVVVLQPTSPLRQVEDIKKALNWLRVAPSVVSYTSGHKAMVRVEGDTIVPLFKNLNRQDEPEQTWLNGGIYGARIPKLMEYRTFYMPGVAGMWMPPERSIDVDREFDLLVADLLLRHRQEQERVLTVGGNVDE